MKSFIELFTDARAVSTPLVAVQTFDPSSTIRNIKKSLGADVDSIPLISWDAIRGLRAINDTGDNGSKALAEMLGDELAATIDFPIALAALEGAQEDVISFIHNPQLVWGNDPKVIQGIWNLRDGYKARGNMLVLLIGPGDTLPTELQQDILVLEEPLPTRDELKAIILEAYSEAAKTAVNGKQKYPACAGGPDAETLRASVDALSGVPAFPADQAANYCLDKKTGTMDVAQLWDRKRQIVSQRQGLTFLQPTETLADMFGVEGFRSFAKRFMEYDHAPSVILRTDEIEKQFAGAGTDSSGSTGKQLGEFISWVEDNHVVCTLLLGVPGSSKSWAVQCIAGHYKRPLIKFDLSAMEDKLVGEGGKILRGNERIVEAISDKKLWLIATANSLRGLPPELISRFQSGGIYFFDVPTDEEKQGILKLKIKAYDLEPDQELPDVTGWSGRDINNAAYKAQYLGCSLAEAGSHIVPLMKSHDKDIDTLRQSAHGKFLSASRPGVYEYTAPSEKMVIKPVVNAGRRVR